MFIQNAVWASVNIANLEAPLLEGTVLDQDGNIFFVPGEAGGTKSLRSIVVVKPYGIVPETVSVFPPTMMVNVCIGGTINVDLPGNEVMNDFTSDIMTQLGEDFNFVKFNERTGGGGDSLPHYDDNDIGKVLTVVSEYETGAEAIPSQTVTISEGTGTVQNPNVSQWTEGQWVSVIYNSARYSAQIKNAEGNLVFEDADFSLIYDSTTGIMTIEDIVSTGDVIISAQYLTKHANADWAEASGDGLPSYDNTDIGKVLTVSTEYVADTAVFEEQTLTVSDYSVTIQNVDASKWTAGQIVSVMFDGNVYRDTIYEDGDALVFNTSEFAIVYNSNDDIMTLETQDGIHTVSANYLSVNADADWSELIVVCEAVEVFIDELFITQPVELYHANILNPNINDKTPVVFVKTSDYVRLKNCKIGALLVDNTYLYIIYNVQGQGIGFKKCVNIPVEDEIYVKNNMTIGPTLKVYSHNDETSIVILPESEIVNLAISTGA